MRRVNINQLKAGMVTAEPVTTRSGQVIIERGVELTRPLIMRSSGRRRGSCPCCGKACLCPHLFAENKDFQRISNLSV